MKNISSCITRNNLVDSPYAFGVCISLKCLCVIVNYMVSIHSVPKSGENKEVSPGMSAESIPIIGTNCQNNDIIYFFNLNLFQYIF